MNRTQRRIAGTNSRSAALPPKQADQWYGLFMCDESQSAGVISIPIRELKNLGLEHPDYWTEESVRKYTGVSE